MKHTILCTGFGSVPLTIEPLWSNLWCTCNADSAVLEAMAAALHPEHGTVIMNLHGGGVPMHNALVALFTSLVSGHGSKGYHASTEQGRAVHDIASVLRYCIARVCHVLLFPDTDIASKSSLPEAQLVLHSSYRQPWFCA